QPADWIPAAGVHSDPNDINSPIVNNVAHATAPQATTDLATYVMNNFYGNVNFTPGHDSLLLRLTPDSTTVSSGTHRYYASYNQMSNDPTIGVFPGALIPTLTLTTAIPSAWLK